jgi:ATP-dependent DNA helicase RecQ
MTATSRGTQRRRSIPLVTESKHDLFKSRVQFRAAPRSSGSIPHFLQACPLPKELVELIHTSRRDGQRRYRHLIRPVAQWRLDCPEHSVTVNDPDLNTVIAVAESLLTRGTTPFCSPALDKILSRLMPSPVSISELDAALEVVAYSPSVRFRQVEFDSDAEQRFERRLHLTIAKRRAGWHVIPQPYLASLSSSFEEAAEERGDYLLVHPRFHPVLVEIDGIQHEHASRSLSDSRRDGFLRKANVTTLRIPADNMYGRQSGNSQALGELLGTGAAPENAVETELSTCIRLCKFAHQIQLSLLEALRGGWLSVWEAWDVVVIPPALLANHPSTEGVIRCAVREASRLVDRLARLYTLDWPRPNIRVSLTIDDSVSAGVVVAPADRTMQNDAMPQDSPVFYYSDVIVPADLAREAASILPRTIEQPRESDVKWFLKYVFRKKNFRDGQWNAVRLGLQGRDSIVLLPTGSGKSIAFQLTSLLLPGSSIIVAPLISLIDDQIENLGRYGIDRCTKITGQVDPESKKAIQAALRRGQFLMCYVSPERFQISEFRDTVKAMAMAVSVSLIAIDEAHCVSEWGHDFRPAYLSLGRVARECCRRDNHVPPIMALTGTASSRVLHDMHRDLAMPSSGPVITPVSFDREELTFSVTRCKSGDKPQELIQFMQSLPEKLRVSETELYPSKGPAKFTGMVFCQNATGKVGVSTVAHHIRRSITESTSYYSGRPPDGEIKPSWDKKKQEELRRFKLNEASVLVCTKAAGMGIDKDNVRYTVHYGLPQSIEGFYQEVGRAGRGPQDANYSICKVILSNDFPDRNAHLLLDTTPLKDLSSSREKYGGADDVSRQLYFHTNSFRGIDQDISDIAYIIDHVRDPACLGTTIVIQSADSDLTFTERALYRLSVLGVVRDYVILHAQKAFEVHFSDSSINEIIDNYVSYIRSYNSARALAERSRALAIQSHTHLDHVLQIAHLMLEFVYGVIELSRRRSLYEMLQALHESEGDQDGKILRERILAYFGDSGFSHHIDAIRDSPEAGFDALESALERLTVSNAAAVRGALIRELGASPEIPGLLMLRGVAEALTDDGNLQVATENVQSGIRSGLTLYRIEPFEIGRACGTIIGNAQIRDTERHQFVEACLHPEFAGRGFLRGMLDTLPIAFASKPKRLLLNQLVNASRTLHE